MSKILTIARWKVHVAEKLSPLALFLSRIVVGWQFWKSGKLKLNDWDSTLTLFEYEHPVPFMPQKLAELFGIENHYLSPEIAAPMGTAFEVICPILLLIGLASRSAAAILLIMTLVIEFSYQSSIEHVYWGTLLIITMSVGPGKLSLDHLIRKRFMS